jgi:hypothetical protein
LLVLAESIASQPLLITCPELGLAIAATGAAKVVPPSVDSATAIPVTIAIPSIQVELEKKVCASAQTTTGSPTRICEKFAAVAGAPRYLKLEPVLEEAANPIELTPLPAATVLISAPVSLNAISRPLPHHAAEVSLCVKPVKRLRLRSGVDSAPFCSPTI